MTGLQLEFTNEVTSACYETKFARENNKFEKVTIDTTKTIRKVAMFVTSNQRRFLNKLRFLDENNEVIAELVCYDDNHGQWITHDIPSGKEIIGIYCNTNKEKLYICRMGFMLWTPPPVN